MDIEADGRLSNALAHAERELIATAIERTNGHYSRMAKWLGLSRRSVYVKVRVYGLLNGASVARQAARICGPTVPFVAPTGSAARVRSRSGRCAPDSRLAIALARVERRVLDQALRRFSGHTGHAARWLGVSRRTVYDKLVRHGLIGEAAARRTEAGIMGPRSPRVAVEPSLQPNKESQ